MTGSRRHWSWWLAAVLAAVAIALAAFQLTSFLAHRAPGAGWTRIGMSWTLTPTYVAAAIALAIVMDWRRRRGLTPVAPPTGRLQRVASWLALAGVGAGFIVATLTSSVPEPDRGLEFLLLLPLLFFGLALRWGRRWMRAVTAIVSIPVAALMLGSLFLNPLPQNPFADAGWVATTVAGIVMAVVGVAAAETYWPRGGVGRKTQPHPDL